MTITCELFLHVAVRLQSDVKCNNLDSLGVAQLATMLKGHPTRAVTVFMQKVGCGPSCVKGQDVLSTSSGDSLCRTSVGACHNSNMLLESHAYTSAAPLSLQSATRNIR